MGSLQEVLGLKPADPEAAELRRVIGVLTADSVRRGRVEPDEAEAAQERMLSIAGGSYLPDVAIAATLSEPDLSAEAIPDKPHRVMTMVLDDTLVA